MSEFFIRPHHMLCLQFFEGKGYSDEFVENMMRVKQKLEQENPTVEIIEKPDDICESCPNNAGGKCKNEDSVKLHDQRVYEQVNRQIGNRADWKDITDAVRTNIIDAGKVKQVCLECKWSEICFDKAK
ncbi:MAG: DUF1284 domain-containing protein [Eubacterium sp.]